MDKDIYSERDKALQFRLDEIDEMKKYILEKFVREK